MEEKVVVVVVVEEEEEEEACEVRKQQISCHGYAIP
jgi:hypothetical protein